MNQIKIYVFGSCHFLGRLDNEDAVGNGGYGIIITSNGQSVEEISGGFSNTTNARMDIIGITEGLKRIKVPSEIVVYLSNGYIIDALSKGWLEKWKKNGFKKIKHVDLWRKLDAVLQAISHSISFRHSRDVKNTHNFLHAEELAKTISKENNLPNDLSIGQHNTTSLFAATPQELNNEIEPFELEKDKPIVDSICVDASCIENPGKMEYRGIDMKTGKVIFEMKYEEATNNIGEFLAIVHALALYKRDKKELKVVYSDSLNAISWVRQKKCKTKLEMNDKNRIVFEHIQRAINWLNTNEYEAEVFKWNTAEWGEIPADYGRK